YQPDRQAYTFLLNGEVATDALTYGALDGQARAIAMLLRQHCSQGDRVVLLYPPGLDYLCAFFGCLYAGVIAVPAYPPNPARLARTLPRLQAITGNARPCVALASAAICEAVGRIADVPEFAAMRWIATDALDSSADGSAWQPPDISGASLAFLQYTSGSTARPRGVMLSHANLLHNSALISQAFGHTPDSRGVIWLPPYHDMGLIGGLIQPLYSGFPVVLLAPVDFLQRPLRWLEAISRFKATTSGGPNFAYDLCVQKISPEERAQLDLSSWSVAFNGAEPVRALTLQRFAEAFAPAGFRPEAFYPCYGLAEATLIVTGGGVESLPVVSSFAADELERHRAIEVEASAGRALVSSGRALGGQQVAIVEPTTRQHCEPGQVGEIWVAGSSVAGGYWEQPDATAQTFGASIAGEASGSYLRTGDLGFVRDGELFVTGRLKDLMIIRGRNYYPQDIELTVERSHPALRPASGAAFTVAADDGERLVVVHELERQQRHTAIDTVAAAIRQAVAIEHDLAIHAVVLLKPGSVPKTSSGKVQRYACRESFLDGTLAAIAQSVLQEPDASPNTTLTRDDLLSAPEAERPMLLERYLHALVESRLGMRSSQPSGAISLLALGLDSLQAVEIQHRLEADLGLVVPITRFLEDQSIGQLAATIVEQLDAPQLASALEAAPAPTKEGIALPLSIGQRALWFLHQLTPTSAAYNLSSAMRIRGRLDIPTLRRTLEKLVERHAALRTSFVVLDGEPAQRINPVAFGFDVEDMPGMDAAELGPRLTELAHRPFDLAHGPLLRVHLFQTADDEAILLLVVHHIVADLWSLSLMIRELSALYSAEQTGQPAALAPLEQSYGDYVYRQQQWLAGSEGDRLWAYWQRQLADAPAVLDLPTDRMRPPVQTYSGAAHSFRLGSELTRQLKDLAQQSSATLYVTLLAAYQVLLYRYTGQRDLLIGTPTSGRSRAGLAGLIGYFVNPVVLRGRLVDTQPFVELLAQARQTVLDALAHQEFPFPLLVERLQPERDLSRSPLFQVMFALHQTPLADVADLAAFALGSESARLRLGSLEMESIALEQQTAQFDLTLTVAEHQGELAAALHYNRDLFAPDTIRRIAGHWQTLLESIVADPDQPIAALPLLSLAERQALLGWNATAAAYPQDRCIHDLVAAQAAQTPDAIALIAGATRLTYAELNRRADRLAAYLHSLKIGPESRVGVCLTRTADLVIGLLATLKAGGAYVPLDPGYPAERLALMLSDARIEAILTERALSSRLPTFDPSAHEPIVVCLDRDAAAIAATTDGDVSRVLPDNLAYILYTSGSTGRPKGVAISHRSAVSLLSWACRTFSPEQLRGTLAVTSINFDLSVFELFVPLSSGGTVILADQIWQLKDLSTDPSITLVNTVPSAISELLQLDGLPPSVQTINLAGEPLSLRLAQQLYQRDHVRQVVNLYGPTEVTTYATWAVVDRDDAAPPTIGRPISNTQGYVLDPWYQMVPVGVIGELYLGGVGLARGYLGRPDLTAERFLPDPFAQQPGARLYRTGDLVRYLPNGDLDYIGRIDHQIKLRGYRIELGEIEAALRQH
ncbi:MAG TPA: amino acid adenylation domain-containing protein, partial [Herpetosiphonaceae bacterium]